MQKAPVLRRPWATIVRMASTRRPHRHERAGLVASLLAFALALPGCAVVSVAGAAAGAAISVGGAVVGSTVRVAGKVVEKTIDLAVPGSPPAASVK
jgi:hypothetical protein